MRKRKKHTKIRCSYINAVYRAGGTPIIIPPFDRNKQLKDYINLIDALVLSGGEDNVIELENINPNRDRWEISLFMEAYKTEIPILGICRGMQLINVALRGSLYQDLEQQLNCEFSHLPVDSKRRKNLEYVNHKVNILKGSRLNKILGANHLNVNFHHQAIKDIAENLNIAARSECGIIEALENKADTFLIGVQWHPEDLIKNYSCFNNLFAELIKTATSK
ncbi:MAG: gamma-glutamyl-gamma-aminobutyrate hydrolase family protein [Halanaerobium sp.]